MGPARVQVHIVLKINSKTSWPSTGSLKLSYILNEI